MNQAEREQKARILEKRPVCEVCWQRPAVELHHCLVHSSKRFHKEVTVEENLMPVCHECHPLANGFREQFAKRQVDLGYDVAGWYRGLPLRVKEQWILDLEAK